MEYHGTTTPTFEHSNDMVVVATSLWRETLVEIPHITDDHQDYA
jgi:hypothetical protein